MFVAYLGVQLHKLPAVSDGDRLSDSFTNMSLCLPPDLIHNLVHCIPMKGWPSSNMNFHPRWHTE